MERSSRRVRKPARGRVVPVGVELRVHCVYLSYNLSDQRWRMVLVENVGRFTGIRRDRAAATPSVSCWNVTDRARCC